MTYAELKAEIRDLGFEEDSTLQEAEYQKIISNACNRAIDEINTTVKPLVKCLRVEDTIDEETQEVIHHTVIDMATEVEDFVDFYEKPKYIVGNTVTTVNDFSIVGSTKIVLGQIYSPLDIYYKAYPTRITLDTEEDFEIELDKVVLPLVALLASFYIWLDDDQQKAVTYRNQYDDLKNSILTNMATPVTVKFGGGLSWAN